MNAKQWLLAVIVLIGVSAGVAYTWPRSEWDVPRDHRNIEESGDGVVGLWGTVFGTVLLGPTCPVVMDSPEAECADKPYKTMLVLTTAADQARVVEEFSSDESGMFRVDVPPGEYAVRSAGAANILPYCQAESFPVSANDSVEITVYCDTGIR